MADRLALFTGGLFAESTRQDRARDPALRRRARSSAWSTTTSAGAARRAGRAVRAARGADRGERRRGRELGANVLVIGVAPFGGALTDEWRAALLEAIDAGMHVEAGLHTVLVRGPGAARGGRCGAGVELRDLRAAPPGLSVPAGRRGPDVHVVHTVGSDCAIGKMSVTLELDAAARARGLESAFVATGQTGIAISGWGIAVDHVISDFVAGAAARLVARGRGAGAAAVRRGPGRARPSRVLRRDARACCTAAGPTCSCSATARARPTSTTTRDVPIPPLTELIAIYEARDRLGPADARVRAIALNTRGLDDDAARAEIERA